MAHPVIFGIEIHRILFPFPTFFVTLNLTYTRIGHVIMFRIFVG